MSRRNCCCNSQRRCGCGYGGGCGNYGGGYNNCCGGGFGGGCGGFGGGCGGFGGGCGFGWPLLLLLFAGGCW